MVMNRPGCQIFLGNRWLYELMYEFKMSFMRSPSW